MRTRLQLWLAETLFEQASYDEAKKLLEETLKIARDQQRTLLVEQGEKLQARFLSKKEIAMLKKEWHTAVKETMKKSKSAVKKVSKKPTKK